MKISRLLVIVIASLLISPMAIAKIYKCDGPDGPVFSDRECGPGAATVELADTSGLSGVSDETKADLARKKAERAEARASSNNTPAVNNYQFTTINTEPAGRWLRWPYRKPHHKPEDEAVNLPAADRRPVKSVLAPRRR